MKKKAIWWHIWQSLTDTSITVWKKLPIFIQNVLLSKQAEAINFVLFFKSAGHWYSALTEITIQGPFLKIVLQKGIKYKQSVKCFVQSCTIQICLSNLFTHSLCYVNISSLRCSLVCLPFTVLFPLPPSHKLHLLWADIDETTHLCLKHQADFCSSTIKQPIVPC